MNFQGCIKIVSRVSRKFPGCFKVVSRKFQVCFEGVLRVLQGSFIGVLRRLQGRFKEVTWMFHESIKED